MAAFEAFNMNVDMGVLSLTQKKYLQFDWLRKVQYRLYCIPPFEYCTRRREVFF